MNIAIDDELLAVLTNEKKIPPIRAVKALMAVDNESAEAALEWLEKHKNDVGIDKPLSSMLSKPQASEPSQRDATSSSSPMEVDDGPPPTENPPAVKDNVSAEMVKELEAMGFALIPSEKALHFTGNTNIEAAIQWLTDHADDSDLQTALRPHQVEPPKPKLSKEEAQKKAYELQMKIKAEREKREKQEAIDKERQRIESNKQMAEAAAKLKEQQRQRDIAWVLKEKEDHEKEKKRQKDIQRQEWRERFGDSVPYPGDAGGAVEVTVDDISGKSKKEQVVHWVNKLKKNHKDTNTAGLRTCISTLRLYINNAQQNPGDSKFHKIKASNAGFQNRVAPFPEGVALLQACGFAEKDTDTEGKVYSIDGAIDGFTCSQAVKFLDLVLSQL